MLTEDLHDRAFKNPVPHDGILMRRAVTEIERLERELAEARALYETAILSIEIGERGNAALKAEKEALREALQEATDALNIIYIISHEPERMRPLLAKLEAVLSPSPARCGCKCAACLVTPHASDCAVHNAPAYPVGACDCGAVSSPREDCSEPKP